MGGKGARISCLLALSVFLFSCGSPENEREEGQPASHEAAGTSGTVHLSSQQAALVGLETTAVEEQVVSRTISATGRLRARSDGQSPVYSPFAGRLVVEPSGLPGIGTRVTKGEILAEVEQALNAVEAVQFSVSRIELQTAIDRAESETELARTERDRSKALYEGGAISLKQLQMAESNLEQAKIRLEGAKKARAAYESLYAHTAGPGRVALRSPVTGVVVAVDVAPGEEVEPGRSLFTVADLSRLWAEAQIFTSDLAAVRRAKAAEIRTEAYPGEAFPGKLVTIGDIVEPTNRTVTVFFSVDNPDRKLKLGMFADVLIATGESVRAIVIPARSLLEEPGRTFVYVETGPGTYERRDVAVSWREDDTVVVSSGLRAGEKLVSAGAEVLYSEASKGRIPTEEGPK